LTPESKGRRSRTEKVYSGKAGEDQKKGRRYCGSKCVNMPWGRRARRKLRTKGITKTTPPGYHTDTLRPPNNGQKSQE